MHPIKVWMAPPGPNPWKVVLVLEELEIPYEIESIRFEHIKQKPFIDLNPNGRVPAIVDPNTDITLWETGAIITYLVEQYDSKKLLTFDSLKEKHLLNQWMFFQASGQGPYFGQAGWFNVHHSERLPSAIERYNKEVRRVLGVLDVSLQGKQWLVGDKLTYVDLAFAPWNERVDASIQCSPEDRFEGTPNVQAWHERVTSRPSWEKAMRIRDKLMEEQGLNWTGLKEGEKAE
ncbi:glutathione S-transferase II [Poronia punctata]|nr:glutathione S-transferase II [Poronia punctata]